MNTIENKDFFGRPLNVGDQVVLALSYKYFLIATVDGFTRHYTTLKNVKENTRGETLDFPKRRLTNHLVKLF